MNWKEAAVIIVVLAVALGVPAVIVEPNPMRHNPIFWPLGMDGPQVTCVKGGDGKPTHDARHTADVLREKLKATKATVWRRYGEAVEIR